MLDLTLQEEEFFERLLRGETGFLVDMYFAIPSDQPDPVLSNHSARCILLCHFSNLALEQPWANEELRLLLKELREQRQPIPAVLTAWAYRNVTYPEKTAKHFAWSNVKTPVRHGGPGSRHARRP